MMPSHFIAYLSLLFFSLFCFADESGYSNLDDFEYPSHDCGDKTSKPDKPKRIKHYDNISDYNNAIIEYNIDVTHYNDEVKVYKSCINLYIKNGNNDLKIIRHQLNKALKEAIKK
ncbi:MAG: hypothetical protein QM484_02820 [Woeseiaceae bacterium]